MRPTHEDPCSFLLKGPSYPPASEVDHMLGRIVQNFVQPIGMGYTPDDASAFHVRKPQLTPFSTMGRLLEASESTSLNGKLSNLVDYRTGKESVIEQGIQSSKIIVYELRKQPEAFAKFKAELSIRTWIDERLTAAGKPFYPVTGVLVWKDANLKNVKERKGKTEISASLLFEAVARHLLQVRVCP